MNPETDIALERLVEAKGIRLTRSKGTLTGRCPLADHDDDTLVIDPKANTWSCTAGCGDGGVVDWVARTEGVSQAHAEVLLRNDFEPVDGAVVKQSTRTRLGTLIQPGQPDAVVLRAVLDFYHQVLLDDAEALHWLHQRKLYDPELLTHFKLGLCDRTLGYRLPKGNRKPGKLVREQLRQIGVLRSSGHEHFRGSLVVPFLDGQGRVQQVYARKLRDDLRKGTPTHVWHTEEPVGVLNPTGFVEGQKIILAASVMDALTWWSWGFRNVTAMPVTEAMTALLVEKQIRSVAVALRRDDDRTEGIASELREMGIEVHQVMLPHGKQVHEVIQDTENPRAALEKLLRDANWVSAGKGSSPSMMTAFPQGNTDTDDDTVTAEDHQVSVVFGDRTWRARGLETISSHATMRVNLMVSRGEASSFHVDVIELYSARQRKGFLSAAATELNVEETVLKKDLGRVLMKLEALVDDQLREDLDGTQDVEPTMSEADRQAALTFLRRPDLLEQIPSDLEQLGLVGEDTNKLVTYLAAISRKLPKPLAVLIQSSPAAGKSTLMDTVLRLVPEEDKRVYSAMTGRSLYYLGQQDLTHKVLAIAEEEGASQAAYALKLLQSEGQLTIASTGKESKTGRLTTQTYAVSGPVALLLTTTALDLDEELLSRCLVLTVDEGRAQTRAIHQAQRQRRSLDGLVARKRVEQVVKLHHDAQRLLVPLHVVLPAELAVGFCDHAVRSRRDHAKLLGLIESIALLRQHQKTVLELAEGPRTLRYIEADHSDVEAATGLLNAILGRTLDELPPGTQRLLTALYEHVCTLADKQGIETCDVRFTRRQIRDHLGLGNTQVKVHLARLVDFELVVVHRPGPGNRVVYELVYKGEGNDGEPFVPGLGCEAGRDRSGVGRPPVGGGSGLGRGGASGREAPSGRGSGLAGSP